MAKHNSPAPRSGRSCEAFEIGFLDGLTRLIVAHCYAASLPGLSKLLTRKTGLDQSGMPLRRCSDSTPSEGLLFSILSDEGHLEDLYG